MSSGIPEIKVRLTPEGVAEVAAALRKVQQDTGRAARQAARDNGILGQALTNIKGLLPTLGIATTVAGLIALGRHALSTGDQIGKMAQRVGASAENVSALAFAAATADVNNEQLTHGLGFLSKNLGDLRKGTGEQIDLFGELGLSAKDFADRDTVQAFALISERLANMGDGAEKTELVLRLIGRGGQALIPLMNDLATKGFANVYAEAQKMGLIFTTDLAKASEAANDSLTLIKKQSEGLAVQFVSGLAPAVVESMTTVREETSGGADALKTLGDWVGRWINGLTVAYLLAGKYIGALTATIAAGSAEGRASITKSFLEDVDQITKKVDPAKLAERAKAVRDVFAEIGADANLSEFERTQKRLAEITKRAGVDQIASIRDVAKQRREIADKDAQAEFVALQAKLAATANLLSSQQQLEQAELAGIRRRVDAAREAYQTETQLSLAKEDALKQAASRQFGATTQGVRLVDQIIKQGDQERLASGTAYYNALTALNTEYLNKFKTAQQQILALDREIADSRKSAAEAVTNIKLQGLSTEEQASLQLRQAWEKDAELRSAVLAGDVDKARKLRDEIVALAQQVVPAAGKAGSIQLIEDAQSKFELLNTQQKQAAQAAAKSAEEGAKSTAEQLKNLKEEIRFLQASGLSEMQIGVSQTALKTVVDKIREALENEEFSIFVKPNLQGVQGQADGGPVAALAGGGTVPGSSPHARADNVLIRATAGEFMQPVRAVRHYGANFMESVRNLTLPKYAEGGLIGGAPGDGAGSRQVVDINLRIGSRSVRLAGRHDQVRELVAALQELKRGVAGD